jgi:hypothetical protein
MSLTTEQWALLERVYQNLKDRPLSPDDPLYQPVYQSPGSEDPVDLMHRHIKFSGVESLQMFSGFRGSGKTTELFRLKKNLEGLGFVVLYGDALSYLNPSEPIDISDLLIVLAGAFSDALEEKLKIDIGGESYWTRLFNYLTKTNIELKEVGIKAGTDLKLALSTTPSFRQKLQEFLSNRIGELKNQLDEFIEDGVKAIRKARGEDAKIVFIFDSLEQIRGSLINEQAVIHSVETLFANHLKKLELPYVHSVYTVPPWLQFVMPNVAKITILPSVRQWNNDDERNIYQSGWDSLRALTKKRFGDQDFKEFFDQTDQADRLITVCGGHFRDLLLLLRETVVRAQSLPVEDEAIQNAIQAVRSNFLPIAAEDALWLDQIEKLRTSALPSNKPEDVSRLTRFLDTHFVLYLANGKEWYDIHPLIREEVAAIAKRLQETMAKEPKVAKKPKAAKKRK